MTLAYQDSVYISKGNVIPSLVLPSGDFNLTNLFNLSTQQITSSRYLIFNNLCLISSDDAQELSIYYRLSTILNIYYLFTIYYIPYIVCYVVITDSIQILDIKSMGRFRVNHPKPSHKPAKRLSPLPTRYYLPAVKTSQNRCNGSEWPSWARVRTAVPTLPTITHRQPTPVKTAEAFSSSAMRRTPRAPLPQGGPVWPAH